VNDEMGEVWKEVIVAYFKVLAKYFPGETEEHHEMSDNMAVLQAENLTPGRTAQYETEILTAQQQMTC
jgi:hypothetical protein